MRNPLAKSNQTGDEIDTELLFNDYWNTKNHQFTVSSQSWPGNRPLSSDREIADVLAIGNHSGYLKLRFSSNPTVRLFVTVHTRRLIVLG
jgi:hypothetical protein